MLSKLSLTVNEISAFVTMSGRAHCQQIQLQTISTGKYNVNGRNKRKIWFTRTKDKSVTSYK